MQFGERVRELRKQRGLTQRTLAGRMSVSLSYISKVENERLNVGDYPSESFVLKLAEALDADADELLLLTDRVPVAIRKRVCERPDVFRAVAKLSNTRMDKLMDSLVKDL